MKEPLIKFQFDRTPPDVFTVDNYDDISSKNFMSQINAIVRDGELPLTTRSSKSGKHGSKIESLMRVTLANLPGNEKPVDGSSDDGAPRQ